MSELLAILFVLGLILVMKRVGVHLPASLALGGLTLVVFSHREARTFLETLKTEFVSLESALLLLVVCGVAGFAKVLSDSDYLERFGQRYRAMRNGANSGVAVMPAVMGLLPVPGGVLLSASGVEHLSERLRITQAHKAVINYWFRHIWEYWWPLYPGLALSAGLLGLKLVPFMLIQFPYTLVALYAGYRVLIRPIPPDGVSHSGLPEQAKRALWTLANELAPVWIFLFSLAGMQVARQLNLVRWHWWRDASAVDVLLALCLGTAWMFREGRVTGRSVLRAVTGRWMASMLLLVTGVVFFRACVMASGLMGNVVDAAAESEIPLALLIAGLPFLAGLLTGIGFGFIGLAFPLLAPFFVGQSMPTSLAFATLAFVSGYVGMLISPTHLCLVLTSEYFHANMKCIYKRLIQPVAAVAGWAGLWTSLLYVLGLLWR